VALRAQCTFSFFFFSFFFFFLPFSSARPPDRQSRAGWDLFIGRVLARGLDVTRLLDTKYLIVVVVVVVVVFLASSRRFLMFQSLRYAAFARAITER